MKKMELAISMVHNYIGIRGKAQVCTIYGFYHTNLGLHVHRIVHTNLGFGLPVDFVAQTSDSHPYLTD